MALNIVIALAGFLLLYYGAEWLVKGSSSLARSLGITPIVIGLTVVAFGTSTPELAVSLVSSIQGKSMLAVGNVIGSNICNIALVLGLAATFQPLTGHAVVVRRDIPVMLGVSLLVLFFSYNSVLGRLEGAVLFAGIIAYTLANYLLARHEVKADIPQQEILADLGVEIRETDLSRFKALTMLIVGIIGVVAGAQLVVNAAIKIMTVLGVSEKFIGLTIVAFGTSLPELATSVVAALRKEMDISIGNLVGSNVFNLLSVLGASALIRPIPIPGGFVQSGLIYDYIFMLFISFLPWAMMCRDNTVSRGNGVFLLICYLGYLVYLIAKA